MVSLSGEWTRPQLNDLGMWLNDRGTDDDYFELNNVVALINMISGQFSYNAMDALMEEYGAQIDSVECDQMVAAVSTRLYCRTTMLKEPLSGPTEYTVNVADAKSLQAVKAQLGDLEAIEYQDADPSPAGSPQFTAKLSKEQVEDLLASKAGDGVNFLECARSAFVRSPSVTGGSVNVDDIEAAVTDGVAEIGSAVVDGVDETAATVKDDLAPAVGQVLPPTDNVDADDSSALGLKAAGAALILSFAAIGLGFH